MHVAFAQELYISIWKPKVQRDVFRVVNTDWKLSYNQNCNNAVLIQVEV